VHLEAYRPEEILKRSSHGWIVVDDEDYCVLAHGSPAAVCNTGGIN